MDGTVCAECLCPIGEGGECACPPNITVVGPDLLGSDPDNNELIGHCRCVFTDCLAVLESKNADYSANDPSGFGNFRALGDNNVELGIITRLGDKWSRLAGYSKNGYVNNEGINDTLMDIINYSAILLAWRAYYNEEVRIQQINKGRTEIHQEPPK